MFEGIKNLFRRQRQPTPQQQEKIIRQWESERERIYHAARQGRLTAGWGGNTHNNSADAELSSSLTTLRSRSRSLIRDNSYAKRAKRIVQDNVVGTGIGMQASVKSTRGTKLKRVNQEIEELFDYWGAAEFCHIGGRINFQAMERQLIGQVFEAGDVFIRLHPVAAPGSPVPLQLELIEGERVADEYQAPFLNPRPGNTVRMGVEMDEHHRPVAYHIRKLHPGNLTFPGAETDKVERVPAEDIIHLSLIDRWPQTRGEPWLHAVARRMNDVDGYSEAEIIRARTQALTNTAIETPQATTSLGTEVEDDGSVTMALEPGIVKRLKPGEKLAHGESTSPNSALDPFMRYMLREIAAGVGVSYESLSRDYSQSNYSSARLALLDDRDLWRVLQGWFIKEFRQRIHRVFMRQAVLARALSSVSVEAWASDMVRYSAVRFKPRGWAWIDPQKEVQAYREAVNASFTTVGEVLAQGGTGLDLEDLLEQRKEELDMMAEYGLVFETSPEFYTQQGKQQPQKPQAEDDEGGPQLKSVG